MSTTTQTPEEIQAAARELYRQSVAAEMPLSGKQIGAQFGKGDRWGRLRIGEVKAETGGGNADVAAERHPEPERNGNPEDGTADRHSGGGNPAPEPETEDQPQGDAGDQDEDLSDPEPTEEPAADTAADVPEGGNPMPETGSATGNHAAADLAGAAASAVSVPVVPRPVPDPLPGAVAVPGGIPQDVPSVAAVPRAGLRLAWAAFLVGTAASIAANVAHAVPQVGARLAGGFVPLALILAVELMCRPLWRRKGWQWQLARYGGTGLVALVTAVMSYSHMRGLLIKYGESDLNATIGPLAVDGLMIVAGFALLAVNDRRDQA